MSKSLSLKVNGHVVNVSHLKKRFPSHSYTQTFIKITVAQEGNKDVLYEAELDDNYILSNFDNLSIFYNYLRRNGKKDILLYNRTHQLTILVNLEDADFDREVIPLSRVQVVDLPQYESLVQRENFYSEVFKTKIVQKIQKTVKKYYKEKTQQGEKDKKGKKCKTAELESEIIFKVQSNQQSAEFNLNHFNPFIQFCVPPEKIENEEFKIKLSSLKNVRLYVYVQQIDAITNQLKGIRKFIQFGKGISSYFWVDEGHLIAIARQQGELVIKNATTNNGKLFSEENFNQVKDVSFKITISLRKL